MVMILTKTRENKGADSVTCRTELVSLVGCSLTALLPKLYGVLSSRAAGPDL